MTAKSEIVGMLGETEVLLPGMLAAALAANDRIKQRLTLLQEAASRARNRAHPAALGNPPEGLSATALAASRLIGEDMLFLPGAGLLLAGLRDDLGLMLAPLGAAGTSGATALSDRAAALAPLLQAEAADEIGLGKIAALTSARNDGTDKFHLLVMDAHKALNALAASHAPENLDGALVHGLVAPDRDAVRAFMRGLHTTSALAFGHPGLGTTAVRGPDHLTIQNDIGTTDAHVLVVHVAADSVTVTYTDIHRPRARFFIGMFAGWAMAWTPLGQRAAAGLEEDNFYLVTGTFTGEPAAVRQFLEYLGSRLVFLIDWNKARKALQIFVGKSGAMDLLAWAAARNLGHRAFLELGGAELIFEIVHRAAAGRIRYGARLDEALGAAETQEFLRDALRHATQGMQAGRGARLIRDEIQAGLARRFETAEAAVFTLLQRHLGLSRCIAEGISAQLPAATPAREAFALRAKRMEQKADRLTAAARETAQRIDDGATLRLVIDAVENTADALEDCASLLALAPPGFDIAPLRKLADIVIAALAAMIRAACASARLPQGQRADAAEALQAIDLVISAERDADTEERGAFAELMRAPCPDARPLLLGLELARGLEAATDHLSHAAFALRDGVLEELSA